MTKKQRPPKIPKKLRQISNWKTSLFITTALLFFICGGISAFYLWNSNLNNYAKISLMAVLLFFAQQGLHLLGWVGHEGFHLCLHKNKKNSAYLGLFFSSMVFSFQQIGSAISHWTHHAHTNNAKDPDVQIFNKYTSFFSRMLFARLHANRIYLKNTIALARNKSLNYDVILPFDPIEIQKMAITNLSLSGFWMITYVIITAQHFIFGLICIIIPHILTILYSSIRTYLEHADTGKEIFDNSRTRNNPFFTFFYFGNNFHLEHHLYPTVPCYNLPKVHQFLKQQHYFEENNTHIVSGVLEAYKYSTKKHQYPS